MYHRPSTCGTRRIESFFPERIQAIENTDEPFEPRFPVE
jgi:hypothetical protein